LAQASKAAGFTHSEAAPALALLAAHFVSETYPVKSAAIAVMDASTDKARTESSVFTENPL
jgi:hypothetical protein